MIYDHGCQQYRTGYSAFSDWIMHLQYTTVALPKIMHFLPLRFLIGVVYAAAEVGVATGACVIACGKIITTIKDIVGSIFHKSEEAPKSPDVHPGEVAGKTPKEIDKIAKGKGLVPKGADPQNGKGSYTDPETGKQRILVHPDADCPHCHVNDSEGNRQDQDGNTKDKGIRPKIRV